MGLVSQLSLQKCSPYVGQPWEGTWQGKYRLLEWALNLMVLNVSTRKYRRAVRLPEGDLLAERGGGTPYTSKGQIASFRNTQHWRI